MALNLLGRMKPLEAVNPHPDPWGRGVTFQVLRYDAEEAVAWRRKRSRGSPVVKGIGKHVGGVMAERMRAARKRAARKEESGGGAPEMDEETLGSAFTEALARSLEAGDVSLLDLTADGEDDQALEEALFLLRGWEGLTEVAEEGEEPRDPVAVEYSPEAARKLLSDREYVVPEGQAFGGLPVGAALVAHLLACSKQAAGVAAGVLGAARGNSGPGSGGGVSPGPGSTS